MNFNLCGDDIVNIIRACSESQVREFKLGEMHIVLMGQNTPWSLTDVANSPDNEFRSVPDYMPDEGIFDKDEELTQKLLSDPLAYEELVEVE